MLDNAKTYYNSLKKKGMNPLDALNMVMYTFHGYTFKGHLSNLFTINNYKTLKGEKKGYTTAILHLSPADLASNKTVCAMADKAGCKSACLNTSGHGQMHRVQASRKRKTMLLHLDPELFYTLVDKNLNRIKNQAVKKEYELAVRFNGTSDLAWEKTPVLGIARKYDANVYDYTKITARLKHVPSDYHITLSYSEANMAYANMIKKAMVDFPHINVAVVFKGNLPETFLGRKVISGDDTDLRFLDEQGVIVGLTAKAKAKNDTSGFVIAA